VFTSALAVVSNRSAKTAAVRFSLPWHDDEVVSVAPEGSGIRQSPT
jgi:hypothetical protein